ncbi:hypothetical protein RRF57_008633 [Xylaria bambusicola]|uniref:DNA repair metallo-beta-lactamase domain-containing protein n=1 Tax=Xylaria bambusicola TaxID=326684 RepID=A0AAN7USG2_9PEZI
MPAKTATRKQPKQSKLNFKPAQAGSTTSNGKKSSTNSNGNILNFFRKVEVEEQLFLPESSIAVPTQPRSPTSVKNDDIHGAEDRAQNVSYKDSQNPSKRRKLSHDDRNTLQDSGLEVSVKGEEEATNEDKLVQVPVRPEPVKPRRARGPFVDDSDSENDVAEQTPPERANATAITHPSAPTEKQGVSVPPAPNLPAGESCPESYDGSNVRRYESCDGRFDGLEDLEGLFGDDYDDEFANDKEYRERRFMEEQARLEAEESGDYMAQACPICNTTLDGITPDQATIHVNACLDGNPLLPSATTSPPLEDGIVDVPQMSRRFTKAAVPRPGQANPINLGSSTNNQTSAFGKLMSGHAEDSAWASAAAAEHASRGKPAYQRTCPFYKIMPGFFICVDAFRYGAVQGCNAYFLSHFHSDHYIGLTANWTHGPIYCSKVTGSLIKNQLRTASKYIKELEFEETVEVPGTEGVTVTMLPANHCPGSSLFLFEKKIGKSSNPRTQRILHCGDFRACPAHVAHPLLKPDLVDTVSGKIKQQKIDICYLDTTYLNPRYSFPPQTDVIEACADFCKALSGDLSTADEAFNRLKREKGSTTVNSFFSKENGDATLIAIKSEDSDDKTRSDPKNRLLVICGTYSIGKERICKAIAQALNTKIFASPSKIKICSQLGDPELTALMTSNPYEAQVHIQMIMEIRAETLQDYLDSYKPHFTRIVGFRPSGWNFRPPTATAKNVPANTSPGSVPTTSILHSEAWRTRFKSYDFVAQRGSTREAMCFGVPYSEHSSFRELALFLMTLRIEKVVPTVNIGSEASRKYMKSWTDRWLSERRKGGIVKVLDENNEEDLNENRKQLVESRNNMESGKPRLWDGKDGKGGGVYW